MVFHLPKWCWIYWNFKVQRNYEGHQIQLTCWNFNLPLFPQPLYPICGPLWLFLDLAAIFHSVASSLGLHRTKLLPLPCDNISAIWISLPIHHSTETPSLFQIKKTKNKKNSPFDSYVICHISKPYSKHSCCFSQNNFIIINIIYVLSTKRKVLCLWVPCLPYGHWEYNH